MGTPLLIAVIAVLMSSAQITTKYLAVRHPLPEGALLLDWKSWLTKVLISPYPWLIGLFMGIAFLCWLMLLKNLNLALAYALVVSSTLLINVFGAWLLFHETLSWNKALGCVIIALGIFTVVK